MEDFVKPLRCQESLFDAGFPQGDVFLKCKLRRLRRILISYIRVERSHQHQGIMKVVMHLLTVRFDAGRTLIVKGDHRL